MKKTLQKIDSKMPAPGWKAALTGLVAAALPLINEVLVYAGKTPLPDSLMLNINVFLTALIVIFLALKSSRPNQYDGR